MTHEIIIKEANISVLGTRIGLAPKKQDFDAALGGVPIRSYATDVAGRRMYVCDDKGLSWLVKESSAAVFSMEIVLATEKAKPGMAHCYPAQPFGGIVRVGKYSVRGPISFETAKIIEKETVPGVSLMWLPDERRVKGVIIGFELNEVFAGAVKQEQHEPSDS